jgi:hypothetical protein
MKVGVTGSRFPRPDDYVARLRCHLVSLGATELHHGDCTGWDKQAHDLAVSMGIKTVAHPPSNPSMRAWCKADIVMPEDDYLARNRRIVDAVAFMVAAPDKPACNRSGTWSTVRYAKRRGVNGVVLTPPRNL